MIGLSRIFSLLFVQLITPYIEDRIHICVYTYVYVYVCMYIYIYIYIYTYACIHIHMCIHVYMCVYIYIYVSLAAYIYIDKSLSLYTYIYICIRTYIYIYIYIFINMCWYVCFSRIFVQLIAPYTEDSLLGKQTCQSARNDYNMNKPEIRKHMNIWALLLKGQKGGGQSGQSRVIQPSAITTHYWPG